MPSILVDQCWGISIGILYWHLTTLGKLDLHIRTSNNYRANNIHVSLTHLFMQWPLDCFLYLSLRREGACPRFFTCSSREVSTILGSIRKVSQHMKPHAYLYKLEFQNNFSDLYSISTGHGGFIRNKRDQSTPHAQILGCHWWYNTTIR